MLTHDVAPPRWRAEAPREGRERWSLPPYPVATGGAGRGVRGSGGFTTRAVFGAWLTGRRWIPARCQVKSEVALDSRLWAQELGQDVTKRHFADVIERWRAPGPSCRGRGSWLDYPTLPH